MFTIVIAFIAALFMCVLRCYCLLLFGAWYFVWLMPVLRLGFGLLCGLVVCWVCATLHGVLVLWWFVALLLTCWFGCILSDFGLFWFSGGFVDCLVLGFRL